MDPPEITEAGGNPSTPTRREVQLQGPRPTLLRVSKESHKIRKLPPHPQLPSQPLARQPSGENRQPVIIYAVSPKIIHAEASTFMSIVQRLTGLSSASTSTDDAGGALSPAARLASIERTSPTERSKDRERSSVGGGLTGTVEVGGVDLGQIPGILSPAPSNLPLISPGMFSSPREAQTPFWAHDMMSPFMYGNSFLPSPSALFSFSPTFSPPADLFNNIFDF
ncbi:hypothetical protein Nepgr_026340 [Nepenthes gracilis]|uniref:VQ domain-containing protein n=1 Tax=Nepenthes gracilis TaxID=150966 RepID=A0AAD3T9K0_NEPGR|nr:hypothetical protein Nepgr_026340 [Nepenthes gracilis]